MGTMDDRTAEALAIDRDSGARERTVDITTIGRRSGSPRRIETWFYRVDGTVYLSGMPGRRGWAANLEAEPAFTFHLKHGVEADLSAHATQIVDEAERRRIMAAMIDDLGNVSSTPRNLEEWVAGSPLFAVEFD
jgi:F420H(2)-dependent quinone reductase